MNIDLKKRAYLYSIAIINFIDGLNNSPSSNIIANQLLRSATSIGANIVEAQAGHSRKDFTVFFSHALKSANESKYWLGLLRDTKKANQDTINKLLTETNELADILAASILTLKGKRR